VSLLDAGHVLAVCYLSVEMSTPLASTIPALCMYVHMYSVMYVHVYTVGCTYILLEMSTPLASTIPALCM
jgi:hypothetical protein